jgi:hypothetical protein
MGASAGAEPATSIGGAMPAGDRPSRALVTGAAPHWRDDFVDGQPLLEHVVHDSTERAARAASVPPERVERQLRGER